MAKEIEGNYGHRSPLDVPLISGQDSPESPSATLNAFLPKPDDTEEVRALKERLRSTSVSYTTFELAIIRGHLAEPEEIPLDQRAQRTFPELLLSAAVRRYNFARDGLNHISPETGVEIQTYQNDQGEDFPRLQLSGSSRPALEVLPVIDVTEETHETQTHEEIKAEMEELIRTVSQQLTPQELEFVRAHIQRIPQRSSKREIMTLIDTNSSPHLWAKNYTTIRSIVNGKIRAVGLVIDSKKTGVGPTADHKIIFIGDEQRGGQDDSASDSNQTKKPAWSNEGNQSSEIKEPKESAFAADPKDSPELAEIKKRLREGKTLLGPNDTKLLKYLTTQPAPITRKSLKSALTGKISPESAAGRISVFLSTINGKFKEAGDTVRVETSLIKIDGKEETEVKVILAREEDAVEVAVEPETDGFWNTAEEDLPADNGTHERRKTLGQYLEGLSEEERQVVLKFGRGLARVVTTQLVRNQQTEAVDGKIKNLSGDLLSPEIPTGVTEEEVAKIATVLGPAELKNALIQSAIKEVEAAYEMSRERKLGDVADFALVQNCNTLQRRGIMEGEVESILETHFNQS